MLSVSDQALDVTAGIDASAPQSLWNGHWNFVSCQVVSTTMSGVHRTGGRVLFLNFCILKTVDSQEPYVTHYVPSNG